MLQAGVVLVEATVVDEEVLVVLLDELVEVVSDVLDEPVEVSLALLVELGAVVLDVSLEDDVSWTLDVPLVALADGDPVVDVRLSDVVACELSPLLFEAPLV